MSVRVAPVRALPPAGRSPVCIGSRWRPGVVERRDTEVGSFELVNSPITTQTEIAAQRALLAPVDASTARRIAQAQAAKHINLQGKP